MTAHQRAKMLGLDMDTEAAKGRVQKYMQEIAGPDNRRLMWVVERALEGTAASLDEKERDLVVQLSFSREGEVRQIEDYIARYTADFLFFHGLLTLLRNHHFEEAATAFVASFGRHKKGTVTK